MSIEVDPYFDWVALRGVSSQHASVDAPNSRSTDAGIAAAAAPGIIVGIELENPDRFLWPNYLNDLSRSAIITKKSNFRIASLPLAELASLRSQSGIASVTSAINVMRADERTGVVLGLETVDAAVSSVGNIRDDTSKVLGKTVVAIIDHGCPFANSQFRKKPESGGAKVPPKSRVKLLWDQDPTRPYFLGKSKEYWGPSAKGLLYGRQLQNLTLGDAAYPAIDELMAKHFDADTGYLDEEGCYDAIEYLIPRRAWSHGAHVMDLATGWPNPSAPDEPERDEASDADIIFVQLPRRTIADTSGGAMSVYVLDALQYIVAKTSEDADVVVNLSFGTYAGPHDGTSFLERAIDELCQIRPRLKVVLPAGNSANEDCHARLALKNGVTESLNLAVMPDDLSPTFVELWWSGKSTLKVSVQPPDDMPSPPIGDVVNGKWPTKITSDYEFGIFQKNGLRGVDATSWNSMALIAIAPTAHVDGTKSAARYGVWTIHLTSSDSVPLDVDAWIERGDVVNGDGWRATQARFLVNPSADAREEYPLTQPVRKAGTLNSYATGTSTYVVGGMVLSPIELADYSSSGPGRNGVRAFGPDSLEVTDESNVLSGIPALASIGSSVLRMNGTSVAAPQLVRRLLNGRSPFLANSFNRRSVTDGSTGLPQSQTIDQSDDDVTRVRLASGS